VGFYFETYMKFSADFNDSFRKWVGTTGSGAIFAWFLHVFVRRTTATQHQQVKICSLLNSGPVPGDIATDTIDSPLSS